MSHYQYKLSDTFVRNEFSLFGFNFFGAVFILYNTFHKNTRRDFRFRLGVNDIFAFLGC